MKQFLSGLLLVVSMPLVQAQNKPHAFVEVFGGLNTASGHFASHTFDDLSSGFAKPGYLAGIQGAFFLGVHLGIGLTVSQADYGINTFSLADGYRENFDVDQATAISKHYKFNNLLVGPYYSFSLSRQLTLDLRALGGISEATLPTLQVVLEDDDKTYPFSQNQATATAFAYQLGAGLRYTFLNHLGLSLRADYFSTTPKFAVTYSNINNSSGRTIDSYNQVVQSLNGTLGIFYQFGR